MERVEADPDDIGAWKLLLKTWFRNQKAVEDELDIVGLFTKLMGTEKRNTFQFRGPDLAKFMVRFMIKLLSNHKLTNIWLLIIYDLIIKKYFEIK